LLGIRGDINLREGELSIRWLYLPENWMIFLVIIGVFAFAFIIYRREKTDASGFSRFILTMLRTLIILLVALVLLGPVLTLEKSIKKLARVILLVDNSLSMKTIDFVESKKDLQLIAIATGLTERDLTPQIVEKVKQLTRLDISNKMLKRHKIPQQIARNFELVCYTFSSGRIKEKTDKQICSTKIDKETKMTAIGDAILAAYERSEAHQIAAIIVISDGRNNFGRDPAEIAERFGRNRVPIQIFTVVSGIPQPNRDFEIKDVEVPKRVLIGDKTRIRFSVGAKNFPKRYTKVEVYLRPIKKEPEYLAVELVESIDIYEKRIKEAEHIKSIDIFVEKDEQTIQQEFVHEFKYKGYYEFIFKIIPHEMELNIKNNYASTQIAVLDKKMKVLFVDYLPRYEYRYLKNALIRDKTLDTWCLLISADPDFPQETSPGLTPLTEYPVDIEKLKEFDAIILGDVHPGSLCDRDISDKEYRARLTKSLKNLKKFVSEFGGGLILMCGEHHNPQAFKGSLIEELLPFRRFEYPDEDELMGDNTYIYQVNPYEKNHPAVMVVPGNLTESLSMWEGKGERGLTDIRFVLKVDELKPAASTVIYAKSRSTGNTYPLFIYMRYGRGYIFYSCTDETWLWRYCVGDEYFYPFWRQILDWARVGKASPGRFEIKVEKDCYNLGEEVKIFVKAYTLDYSPAEDPPDAFIRIDSDEQELKLNKRRERGYFEAKFLPQKPGIYVVKCGKGEEWVHDAFKVVVLNREEADLSFNKRLLEDIAKLSGGKFFTLANVELLPKSLRRSAEVFIQVQEEDLWDAPLIYILFALLITSEWVIRKIIRLM
jgi:uncharacterized membrane protein